MITTATMSGKWDGERGEKRTDRHHLSPKARGAGRALLGVAAATTLEFPTPIECIRTGATRYRTSELDVLAVLSGGSGPLQSRPSRRAVRTARWDASFTNTFAGLFARGVARLFNEAGSPCWSALTPYATSGLPRVVAKQASIFAHPSAGSTVLPVGRCVSACLVSPRAVATSTLSTGCAGSRCSARRLTAGPASGRATASRRIDAGSVRAGELPIAGGVCEAFAVRGTGLAVIAVGVPVASASAGSNYQHCRSNCPNCHHSSNNHHLHALVWEEFHGRRESARKEAA